jgi:flagellar protein FlaG
MQTMNIFRQASQVTQGNVSTAARGAERPEPTSATLAVSKPSVNPEPVSVERAIQQIEGFLAETNRKLSVSFDDASNRYITRVINKSTGEVIRTIPEEETLKIAQSIQGRLVNLRA